MKSLFPKVDLQICISFFVSQDQCAESNEKSNSKTALKDAIRKRLRNTGIKNIRFNEQSGFFQKKLHFIRSLKH